MFSNFDFCLNCFTPFLFVFLFFNLELFFWFVCFFWLILSCFDMLTLLLTFLFDLFSTCPIDFS